MSFLVGAAASSRYCRKGGWYRCSGGRGTKTPAVPQGVGREGASREDAEGKGAKMMPSEICQMSETKRQRF